MVLPALHHAAYNAPDPAGVSGPAFVHHHPFECLELVLIPCVARQPLVALYVCSPQRWEPVALDGGKAYGSVREVCEVSLHFCVRVAVCAV